VPPEEFFDSRVTLGTVCPEAALMYAVLEDAFICFQKQFEMERPRMQHARQAEKRFFSNDFHWLFPSCLFAMCSDCNRSSYG
jgi:hypothetical protein